MNTVWFRLIQSINCPPKLFDVDDSSERAMSQQWHSSTGIASDGVNARYRMELL